VLGLVLLSALACAPALVLSAPRVAIGQDREGGAREEAAVFDDVEEEAVDQDVDSDVRQEGGQKVKVFRFSGLDLAGRLKSPQLLYFLNRMRAEFDRPRLPHRSFIPELQDSAQGKALR
jgi:hypothetical protein